jgi:hypothetical protein
MGAKHGKFSRENNGHTHKTHEEVQSSSRVVVCVHPFG